MKENFENEIMEFCLIGALISLIGILLGVFVSKRFLFILYFGMIILTITLLVVFIKGMFFKKRNKIIVIQYTKLGTRKGD